MIVFLNGKFVAEEQAVVSVFDRGFLYGDGLFEALRVANGKPFRWDQHWQRLERGAQFLKFKLAYSRDQLREFAHELIAQNNLPESLLRLTVSRGIGPRGYSPKGADHTTTVLSLHDVPAVDPTQPPQWRLVTASPRLPAAEPVAQYKTCNKLAQVLARGEADAAQANEALLLNTNGFVIEGASSNLFWVQNGALCTPPLVSGVLAGVTRAVVSELCGTLGLQLREAEAVPDQLRQMDAVFLSLSTVGIAEAVSLDNLPVHESPVVKQLSVAYWEKVRNETWGITRGRR